MLKKITYGLTLISLTFLLNVNAIADTSPTMDQVYQAAHSGRMDEAQRMMDQVLKEHPNSAKAHFVEAELLVKQGQIGRAEEELKNAERLKPDLSFASPHAVQELKSRIASSHHVNQPPVNTYQTVPASDNGSSFPWGMVILGVCAIVIVFLIIRARSSRNTYPTDAYRSGMQNTTPNSPMPMSPYGGGMGTMNPGMGMGGGVMNPGVGMGGGIGSGIMGGLATGAAVGVGMVAGEALAHRFMDGGRNEAHNVPPPVADTSNNASNYDMGGSDFGISDNSSWSDSSSVADSGSDSGSDWG